jgi:microcystin-dependent protein
MSEPYLGEIAVFGFNFAPVNWAFCDGAIISIDQNDALYSLVGTTFGGDGVTTFGVPDFRGRAGNGQGAGPGLSNRSQGQKGGVETVTLQTAQMPAHTHGFIVSTATGDSRSPVGAYFANEGSGQALPYSNRGADSTMGASLTTSVAGSGQAHNNMPPYVALNFCICLSGIYPSQP